MSRHSRGTAVHWAAARWNRPHPRNSGNPTDPSKDAALILDGKTGRVLYTRNADAQRHPASLTKMMTLYLLFDALKKGQVNLNTPIYISQHAASQYPTKLGLPAGNTVPVDIAIRAAVVLSANDIAVAIAEALGGTEAHFAQLMTEKARELGMRNTFYHNASGLPDDRQITTAADLGLLARHLAYDFPQFFHYFSLESFSYRGRTHLGHDNLLGRYPGADGIKTGYTNASGFNLVSSVVRSGAHIIGVVMGGRSAFRRDNEMMRLLDMAFAEINAQPQLVAHAEVPWQTMAQTSNAQPVIAGFEFGTSSLKNTAPAYQSDTLMQSGENQMALARSGQEIDEETAESESDRDEAENSPAAPPAPKPQTAPPPLLVSKPGAGLAIPQVSPAPAPREQVPPTAAPQVLAKASSRTRPVLDGRAISPFRTSSASQPQIPLINPIARSAVAADSKLTRLASLQITAQPAAAPQLRAAAPSPPNAAQVRMAALTKAAIQPGTISPKLLQQPAQAATNPPLTAQGWAIQIGAFGDEPSARAQLSAYAARSVDLLGSAQRIIIPFQGVDGKTMYRARFGPFPEQQARAVCATLTQRGQTCFAATMAH